MYHYTLNYHFAFSPPSFLCLRDRDPGLGIMLKRSLWSLTNQKWHSFHQNLVFLPCLSWTCLPPSFLNILREVLYLKFKVRSCRKKKSNEKTYQILSGMVGRKRIYFVYYYLVFIVFDQKIDCSQRNNYYTFYI